MGAVRMLRPNHKGEDNKRIHPRARTWCPTCRHPSLNALDVGYPWRGTKFSDVFDVPFGSFWNQGWSRSIFFIFYLQSFSNAAQGLGHGTHWICKTHQNSKSRQTHHGFCQFALPNLGWDRIQEGNTLSPWQSPLHLLHLCWMAVCSKV